MSPMHVCYRSVFLAPFLISRDTLDDHVSYSTGHTILYSLFFNVGVSKSVSLFETARSFSSYILMGSLPYPQPAASVGRFL